MISDISATSQEIANINVEAQRRPQASPADLHGMWYPGMYPLFVVHMWNSTCYTNEPAATNGTLWRAQTYAHTKGSDAKIDLGSNFA